MIPYYERWRSLDRGNLIIGATVECLNDLFDEDFPSITSFWNYTPKNQNYLLPIAVKMIALSIFGAYIQRTLMDRSVSARLPSESMSYPNVSSRPVLTSEAP